MIFNRDYRFLDICKVLARKSNARNFKFGALIAKGRKVLGVGHNDVYKTHPLSTTYNQYIHAELDAILGTADEDLSGATIYVRRSGAKEAPLLSRPCYHCMALIKRKGIKNIVYVDAEGNICKEVC